METSHDNLVLVRIGPMECSEEFEIEKDVGKSKVPLFHEALSNISADSKNKPTFTDITPRGFRAFIGYLKTRDVHISTVKEAVEVYQVAQKFEFQELESVCQNFLSKSLTPRTALEIFNIAVYFDNENLKQEYFSYLAKNTQEIFKYGAIRKADETTIETIVKCPQLSLESEIDLFLAVVAWGEAECLRRGLRCTPCNLRTVLQKLIPHINFLEMTPEEFVMHVVSKNILTLAERHAILINHFIDSNVQGIPIPKGFSTVQGFRTCRGSAELDVCKYDREENLRMRVGEIFLCNLMV